MKIGSIDCSARLDFSFRCLMSVLMTFILVLGIIHFTKKPFCQLMIQLLEIFCKNRFFRFFCYWTTKRLNQVSACIKEKTENDLSQLCPGQGLSLDPESLSGTLGVRWDYTMNWMPVHHRASSVQTFTL